MTTPNRASKPLLAIGCLSASIFLFEVLLTRLFSVILYHHFAFVAISVGMLGLATAGVRVALAGDRFRPENAARDVRAAAVRFAIAALVAVAILVQVGLSPSYTWLRAVAIVFIYAISFFPFYFGGLAITLLLTHFRERFARLYATDLTAAGVSGILVAPLLSTFGAPSALLLAAVVAALGALLAFPSDETARPAFGRRGLHLKSERTIAWATLAVLGVSFVLDQGVGLLRVRRPKEEDQGTVLYEGWNAISRVAVYEMPMRPWSVGPKYAGPVPAGKQMDIDASAATPILHGMTGPDVEYLKSELTAAAYSASPKEHALVIGAGGGRDVLSALLAGMGHVDAVEINGIIVDKVMRGAFKEFSGGLYVDPRVTVHVGDGRSFVRGSTDKYDVIQASLVDTWAATAAGAFALSENNLYTLEAMTEYIGHLSDDGILTLVRWEGGDVYRLIVMLHAAAHQLGIADPARHIAIVTAPHTPDPKVTVANVMFRRSAWDAASIAKLEEKADLAGFGWAHHPLKVVPGRTSEIARAADPLSEATRTEDCEMRPSTDDWPFFFYRPRPSFFAGIFESPRRLYSEGPYVLAEILAFATLLGSVCLLLPMWRRGRTALKAEPGVALVAGLYFVGIGAGFMFLEISMMQRFVLFLGHPTYALTAVTVGLLVGAGMGSLSTSRVAGKDGAIPMGALAAAAAVAAVFASSYVQGAVFAAAQQMSLVAKIGLTQLLVVPLGFVLGTPMALGVARLTKLAPALVPWAWGINGFASVVGSCLAVLLSMTWGFTTTFHLGAGCYAIAACAALVVFRKNAPAEDSTLAEAA